MQKPNLALKLPLITPLRWTNLVKQLWAVDFSVPPDAIQPMRLVDSHHASLCQKTIHFLMPELKDRKHEQAKKQVHHKSSFTEC